ncbi:MAG: zinc-binding protein [Chloroflexota bacterium]|nr:zinc-binding protein [Chloroflexota bacterium]
MSNKSESRNSKHCHLCGRRLWGGGWVYTSSGVPDGQSIVVCRRCQGTAPRCDVCGVPMSDNHVRLPDDRRTCLHCHQTAVYDPTRARTLFEHVARVVTDQLNLGLNVGAEFTLVDSQHLQRLAAEASTSLHETPGNVVGLFVRKGRKRVMYLLSGLPQILLIQTVAHEWAHAWQGENCPLLQNPLVREGFAEWAAYKTLQTMGAVKKMVLMEQQNGLYGEGLREMLELEQREGMSGVLAFCRQAE